MGLEDAIARQQAEASATKSAADAELAEVYSRCREFFALVQKHRIRPAGFYYREVSGSRDATTYERVGRYWNVTEDDTYYYGVSDRGEPLTMGRRSIKSRHSRVEFRGPAPDGSTVTYEEQPPNGATFYSYQFSEDKLASAFLHEQKHNGTG